MARRRLTKGKRERGVEQVEFFPEVKTAAGFARSIEDLAEALGVSRRYVVELRRKGMAKAVKKTARGYDVQLARAWYRENVAQRHRAENGNGGLTRELDAARLRKRLVEADLLEMEAMLRRGELRRAEEVDEQRALEIRFVRENLLSLARPLSLRVAGKLAKEAEKVLRSAFRELLEGFAS